MATVYDVAQYILRKYEHLDAMKLQKLVYYSQAWRLVQSGVTLFDEPIKAYKNGPVVGLLFHRHKGRWTVKSETIGSGCADSLSEDEQSLVDAVLAKYGPLSAGRLSQKTHDELPWQQARAFEAWDDTISIQSMRDFYSAQLVYEPDAAPKLTGLSSMLVRREDLDQVMDTIDEPDDADDFLLQVAAARAKTFA